VVDTQWLEIVLLSVIRDLNNACLASNEHKYVASSVYSQKIDQAPLALNMYVATMKGEPCTLDMVR
jgi:hypothetical protein